MDTARRARVVVARQSRYRRQASRRPAWRVAGDTLPIYSGGADGDVHRRADAFRVRAVRHRQEDDRRGRTVPQSRRTVGRHIDQHRAADDRRAWWTGRRGT